MEISVYEPASGNPVTVCTNGIGCAASERKSAIDTAIAPETKNEPAAWRAIYSRNFDQFPGQLIE